ncbi:Pentatricopeptide repeat-containing protein At2g35130, partial [Linum perenne]
VSFLFTTICCYSSTVSSRSSIGSRKNIWFRQPNSGAIMYSAYIDGLMKAGNSERAVESFQRMRRDSCQPST